MKRLLAVLLTLAVLAGLVPGALAEPAPEPVGVGLPAVGDVVYGFEALETREAPRIGATVVLFVHRKTGAELFYIANDDTNRAFDLAFFTDAIDNTGLPHVFEHATTAGSKKYPSSALWFNLTYQTYNTFMNAMTNRRFTAYPLASLSEAQLLKYADYYADSCFNPTLMENEQVYRTEAWRYRMEDADAPLSIEGAVYSEMQGAWTLQRVAGLNALRAMFPGSMVGNDPYGDPDFIPDMTYEMLTGYHDLYYHPSNCVGYLYGQFEDYAAFLELLDGYFSEYEKKAFTRSDDSYTPITEPVVQSLPFPVEQGSGTEHASVIFYGFVCPGLKDDGQQELLMNTLTDLLADGASDFQQSLQQALPYGSFTAYIEQAGPEFAIVFRADNVDPADADAFKATVDAALENVAANGFPQDQVDGVMTSLNISAKLTREDSDPVNGILNGMIGYYASTGNPWEMMDYNDSLFLMDEWNRDGLYAEAVSKWLVGSPTTALVTTYPEPGAKEAHDAALAEKLAGVKAGMTDEEIAAIVEASNTPLEKEDASELVASLQAVTVASLPEEWKLYDVTDETDENGARRIDAVAGVEGIGQVGVLLDAAGLSQEDIHWAQLYTDLVMELDTAAHTKAELAKQISRYLYSGGISLGTPMNGAGDWHPYLSFGWTALDDDLEAGYDLMREILLDTKVDDAQRLSEEIQTIRASMKTSVSQAPLSVMARRALAVYDDALLYNTYAQDLEYYEFLGQTQQLIESDPDAAVAKLRSIQAYFNNRTNAVTMFAGNADSIALNRRLADAFLASLDSRPIEPAEYDLPVPAASEALVIDSGIQFNMLVASYEVLGLEGYTGDMSAALNTVSDTFLVPLLRDQYGVYTPMQEALDPGGILIYTYCDPNVAETYQVLETLPELVANMDMDQETLDGYIMNAYSELAMPKGELTGASEAAMAALMNEPQDKALTRMRELKALTPEILKGYSDIYARMLESGVMRTAGGAASINANADLFDAILNPFGAVDTSQIAFADVPEDSEHYQAVRFAFENRLMLPASDDAFGVDEPATNGDLMAAANAMIGGEPDAEAGLAAFVEYGLAQSDTDLNAPLAPADFWSMMSALAGAQVEAKTETADPEAATRGELAEMLMAFMNSMQG